MTSHERFRRMYNHQEADRVPILDSPWQETLDRWQREGMPTRDYVSYFDLDRVAHISVDISPRYPVNTIEETQDYVIHTTPYGVTLRNWKRHGSTPEFLDFTITSYEKWLEARARMADDDDRIPWDYLKANYPMWKQQGYWITAGLWFGFDVSHSWAVGTERFLMAMAEQPEWCIDMYNHYLDTNIKLLQKVWDAGYVFDEVNWPNDMGYKQNQFFSMAMYRRMDKPPQRRAVEWAHKLGVYARMHSCGDISVFIPELIEIGIDALNPLEVKAGLNPIELKKKYGGELVLHGGINAVLWDKADLIVDEIRRVVPAMKENGGYIFASDHSIPENVSLDNFKLIIQEAKKAGSYT